jgi:uncharacterized protein YfbU (UPF0304 family)
MADNTPHTLAPTERLQLAQQHEILEKLDPDNAEHHAKCREILQNGFTLLYGEVFQDIYEEVDQDACEFVYDVLAMYRDLMRSYDAMVDKAGIELDDVRFAGFDGNNESRLYGFIKFLKGQGLWDEPLATSGMNSHYPTIGRYQKMLANYKAIRDKYDPMAKSHDLTAEEIKQVMPWRFQHAVSA